MVPAWLGLPSLLLRGDRTGAGLQAAAYLLWPLSSRPHSWQGVGPRAVALVFLHKPSCSVAILMPREGAGRWQGQMNLDASHTPPVRSLCPQGFLPPTVFCHLWMRGQWVPASGGPSVMP